jgi:hypothetical protein
MPKGPNLMFKCICLFYNVKKTWTLILKTMNVSSFDTPRRKDEIVLKIIYFLKPLLSSTNLPKFTWALATS